MMSKEKQIEELSEFFYRVDRTTYRGGPIRVENYDALALALYDAGYRKKSEGEWISVEERLPESLQRVLVIDTKGDMFTSVYISFATGKNAWSTQNSYLGDVTHWMPLPEPPKTD